MVHVPHFTLEQKKFTIHRTVFLQWGTFLSEPLLIVGLVGRYLTNYLIRSVLIHNP